MAESQVKRCGRCKQERPISEFGRCSRNPDGLRETCRGCRSIEARKYRNENRDACAGRIKAWRNKNPDKARAICRRYEAAHREKRIEKSRRYKQNNVEAICLQRKAYRAETADHIAAYNAKYAAENRDELRKYRRQYAARYRQHCLRRRARKLSLPDHWTEADALWAMKYFGGRSGLWPQSTGITGYR